MLHAVVMAGGSGTRFWPKSRRDRPKQLLRLLDDRTMLQRTLARVEGLVSPDRAWVVTGADQAAATREQLPELPWENVIVEPCPRDTAPCVGLAAGLVAARDPDATMIVMPADHVIQPTETFQEGLRVAASVVEEDPSALVTFGIAADRPETGYGYIERGELLERRQGLAVYRVERFREKPDRAAAEEFLASGRFLWNSGIFVWRARTILNELRAHRPAIAEGLEPIFRALGTPDAAHALERYFPTLERAPIDKAVMERAANVCVIEARYHWNDVGDWRALAPLLEQDSGGNAIQGRVVASGATNSIIVSDDGGLVAALGVDDLLIVHSGKATLVARKDRLDELKALVEKLRDAGHEAFL